MGSTVPGRCRLSLPTAAREERSHDEIVPFVGSAASSLVFHERVGPLRLPGMLTVIAGIAVMLLSRRTQALPKIVGA